MQMSDPSLHAECLPQCMQVSDPSLHAECLPHCMQVSDPSTGMLSDGTLAYRRDPGGFGRGGPDGRVNFGEYVLQLRYAPVPGDGGAPIIGSKPEDRERAAAVSQARFGSAVLPVADYLMFTTAPPLTKYTWVESSSIQS